MKTDVNQKAPTRKLSHCDRIYQDYLARIQSGDVAPEDRLVDSTIAASLGVSRMPVRDAMMRLVHEGYLTTSSRGFKLPVWDKESVLEVFELRRLLEPRAAGLAVQNATPEIIDAIGQQHKRGRRLFIGTVNLDAARSVIWNIGAIAVSDYAEKHTLIREIMRASAAIPVAFPPVMIPVEVNGKEYDEMHVDGGTGSQVFVYPSAIDWHLITEKLKVVGHPEVYIIRNAFLEPDYNGVLRNLMPIAGRSIDSLIRTQGIGDLYQIYALCERDGNDFNLAHIPADFTEEPTEGFDPVYMTKLYDRGFSMAVKGYQWEKTPPGFDLKD